jgi:AraC-like DNA-binding protein
MLYIPPFLSRRRIGEAVRPLAARRIAADLAQPRPCVLTWLDSRERLEADAAGEGHVRLIHCTTLDAVRRTVLTDRVDAVLVSAALMNPRTVLELGRIAAEFSTVVFVGLVTEPDRARAVIGAQLLGNAGVLLVIDSRARCGWAMLRETMTQSCIAEPFLRNAAAVVLVDIEADTKGGQDRCSDGCRRFFQELFTPEPGTAGDLARRLGVQPATFVSRFARAGLPSPKQYLSVARLVWAAHLAETPARTISAISARLGVSSPQSFGRTVRRMLGMTATEFRSRFSGREMLDRLRDTLVIPYRDTLRVFDPVAGRYGAICRTSERLGQGDEPCE